MTARSGALEICTNPVYGVYISNIKKMAHETDSAAMNKLLTAVALTGANNPKLTKIAVSQRTSTITSGMETEVVACSYMSQRVFPISTAILNA